MTEAKLDELRREVAADHGLPAAALPFITAATLQEIEAQAGTLARLRGTTSSEQESKQAAPLADLFSNAAAEKARRQRALVAALHGRPSQPRDGRGRFSTGFDGGARQPVPAPRDPERDHSELLGQIVGLSRVFRDGF